METENKLEEIKSALSVIPASSMTYSEWIGVGMALKEEGLSCKVWDDWSAKDASRYEPGLCVKKWRTFNGGSGNKITINTVFSWAYKYSWQPKQSKGEGLEWDAIISAEELQRNRPEEIGNTAKTPVEQLKEYLTLFHDDEYINIVTSAFQRKDGKWAPGDKGINFLVSDLKQKLDKHSDDLGACIGDWNKEAGAWVRFNPSDGQGVGNDNATAYRYTLVESDEMSIEEQLQAYKEFNLPIAALVKSGGKSLHAIVKIEAKDADEYRERVGYLYQFLEKHDFKVDEQNKNVMRLSRLPGVTRGGQRQDLISLSVGAPSWSAWRNEQTDSHLPSVKSFAELMADPPPVPAVLIDGLLRKSHKGMITGPSKAGKTFLIMQLALSLAKGTKWLGLYPTRQSKVVYINFEIEGGSFYNRFIDIYAGLYGISHNEALNKMQTDPDIIKNLFLWNLRGYPSTNNNAVIVNEIVRVCSLIGDVGAVFIDPVYKMMEGDENKAEDVSRFVSLLDFIAHKTQASIIYCHHHSKGSQSGRSSLDQGAGSGVWGRDVDWNFNMLPLVPPSVGEAMSDDDLIDDIPEYIFKCESTVREFRAPKAFNLLFKYPTHRVTHDHDDYIPLGDKRTNLKQYNKAKMTEERDDRKQTLINLYEDLRKGNNGVPLANIKGPYRVALGGGKNIDNYWLGKFVVSLSDFIHQKEALQGEQVLILDSGILYNMSDYKVKFNRG